MDLGGESQQRIQDKKIETDSVTGLRKIRVSKKRLGLSRDLARADQGSRQGNRSTIGPEQCPHAPSAKSVHLQIGEDFSKDVFLWNWERGTGLRAPASQASYLCLLVSKMGCVMLPKFWYHFQHGKALQMLLSHHPASTWLCPIP